MRNRLPAFFIDKVTFIHFTHYSGVGYRSITTYIHRYTTRKKRVPKKKRLKADRRFQQIKLKKRGNYIRYKSSPLSS